MLSDVRFALRTLARQKSFLAAALLTLALGIGATTAIFSVVYGVLLRPLPLPDPGRLVQLSEIVPGGNPVLPGATWISNLTLYAWEPHRTTIGPIATFSSGSATVGLDRPRRVRGGNVAPEFFNVLGVRPVLGRFFRVADAVTGAGPVVVLSEETWRDEFGGSPHVVGRTITIDDRPHQIIGIAPPGIALPDSEARFWTPARVSPPLAANGRDIRVEGTRAIARLAAGATPAQAAAEGTMIARGVSRPLPFEMLFGKGGPVEVRVLTLSDQMTMRVRPALLVLLAAVCVLLMIACVNVANLFLSRGVSRERELAVRIALGARHGRLVRELLAESLAISVMGGALGVAIAWALVRSMPAVAPRDFPRIDAVHVDWRAFAVGLFLSLVAGLMSGLVPALRAGCANLIPGLREGSGASTGRPTTRFRQALLIAEASLAVVVLIGATLLGRSFVHLIETDPGYDVDGVLTARLYLPGASAGRADTAAFLSELLPRVRAIPGVAAAGGANMAPLGDSSVVSGFTISLSGRPAVTVRALTYVVTPGYAEALGLQLAKGRFLHDADIASPLEKIVVNEEFVRTFLSGIEPVGCRLARGVAHNTAGAEIVGVVGNVLKDSLDQRAQPELYVLAAEGVAIRREINLVLRVAGDPVGYVETLRRVVAELGPDVAVENVRPLSDQLSASVAQPRFTAAVLVSFAALALALAAIGLYGVLSYTVARRKREIGVRAALGASPGRIVRMIIREGMVVAVFGLVLGVAAAAASTRLMQTLLVGIQPLDLISFAAAPAALVVVALVACAVPARRAAHIDPAVALRQE